MSSVSPVRPEHEPKPLSVRMYHALGSVPFWATHVVAVVGMWKYGVTLASVVLGLVLFFARLWGITAGYHRYFSHRAYKTSRGFQFFLALLAQTSAQKSALWWAAHHRVHHKHSDDPEDVHSPKQRGFWYAHVGWLFDDTSDTRMDKVRDLVRYPELLWLDRNWLVPPIALGVICYLTLGMPGLFVGFFASTVLLWHNTFFINSLAHVVGKRRFETTDTSRNNWFLAILTLGEGWHNNHHHYQSSARNGFYWWEIDVTYYVLRVLAAVGLVWDLRPVPAEILEEGRQLDAARRAARATPARASEPAAPSLGATSTSLAPPAA